MAGEEIQPTLRYNSGPRTVKLVNACSGVNRTAYGLGVNDCQESWKLRQCNITEIVSGRSLGQNKCHLQIPEILRLSAITNCSAITTGIRQEIKKNDCGERKLETAPGVSPLG